MNDDTHKHTGHTWQLRGQVRPRGAVTPRPEQESVWDYPRPPVIVDDTRLIQVRLNNVLIAETRTAMRVLETASPPTFYLPPESVQFDCMRSDAESSYCEWKGRATYFSVCVEKNCVKNAAWTYPEPHAAFTAIRNYLAFYPGRLECYIDGERVQAQAGGFYGGWISKEVIGPFKGDPGTSAW